MKCNFLPEKGMKWKLEIPGECRFSRENPRYIEGYERNDSDNKDECLSFLKKSSKINSLGNEKAFEKRKY
jgi:hypothetical protein